MASIHLTESTLLCLVKVKVDPYLFLYQKHIHVDKPYNHHKIADFLSLLDLLNATSCGSSTTCSLVSISL